MEAAPGGPRRHRRRAAQFGDRLAKQLDERGAVDVLRHGVNDHGIEVRLAFFKPAHGLTPELTARYLANRLTVTRQLPYEADATKTLDLCLFVNGIPVATAELKNPLTGQTVEHAKAQYRHGSRPGERDARAAGARPLRGRPRPRRDDDASSPAPTTRFLPFNRGNAGGQGNPPDPDRPSRPLPLGGGLGARRLARPARAASSTSCPGRGTDASGPAQGGRDHLPALPPVGRRPPARGDRPRRGSWPLATSSSTRRARARRNTIAWLAHRLMSLHGAGRPAGLRQGRRDHRPGHPRPPAAGDDLPVRARDGRRRADRPGLAPSSRRRSTGEQARIVITTLQKFPFILDKVDRPRAAPLRRHRRRGPLVADRRGRQGPEGGARVGVRRGAAGGRRAAPKPPTRRPTRRTPSRPTVAARGRQPNLSFFAFTATPKARTLELFGRQNADGSYAPVPPLLDAPGHRGGLHPRRARQLHDLRDLLEGRQGGRGRPRVRHAQGAPSDRPLRLAASPQPRPEGRDHRRALPRAHPPQDRRPGQGDGRHLVAPPRRALQAGASTRYLAEKGYADTKALVAFSGRGRRRRPRVHRGRA